MQSACHSIMASLPKSPSKKRLRFVAPIDLTSPPPSEVRPVDWKECILCRGVGGSGQLKCPASNPNRTQRNKGYTTLAGILLEFQTEGLLPHTLRLEELDDGTGIEETFKRNKAVWHKTCELKYSRQELTRLKTRRAKENVPPSPLPTAPLSPGTPVLGKRNRADISLRSTDSPLKTTPTRPLCVLCGKGPTWKRRLHEISNESVVDKLQVIRDKHPDVRKRATLSGLFVGGTLISRSKLYHNSCLVQDVYDCGETESSQSENIRLCESIAFAELIVFIKEKISEGGSSAVFKMGALTKMYRDRLSVILDVPVEEIAPTQVTHFRERILQKVTDLEAKQTQKEYYLVPKDTAFYSAVVAEGFDEYAVVFGQFVSVMRRIMDQAVTSFSGSLSRKCQIDSVPAALLAVSSKMLYGSHASEYSRATQPALSLAQLLLFNYKKSLPRGRIVRQAKTKETPLAIYIGLSTWGKTRKREVVDIFHGLGLSISSTRIQEITSALSQWTVDRAFQEGFLCPANLLNKLFTALAYDNFDFNPSSSTAVGSFHGTGMTVLQLVTAANTGERRVLSPQCADFSSRVRSVPQLPDSYGTVKAVTLSTKQPRNSLLQAGSDMHPQGSFLTSWTSDQGWLEHVALLYSQHLGSDLNFSWSAFHATMQQNLKPIIPGINALLPLFYEDSASVSMMCHGFNVCRKITNMVNTGQTPVMCVDEPLFRVAKIIQWNWPHLWGENHLVLLMGPFHIEQAFLKLVGHVMEGCGWVSVMVSAGLATETSAVSLMNVHHLKKSRTAHEVTAATLFILLKEAYEEENTHTTMETWIEDRSAASHMFYFWILVLNLEVLLLRFVRSLRSRNYREYLSCLKQMAPWFFSQDRVNYARWLPVHIKDLVQLPQTAPDVHSEFENGNFSFPKTTKRFSAEGFDQTHEQNNAMVKGDGGVIGLTENPEQLRRWMLAGPEVQRLINEFEADSSKEQGNNLHHEQYSSFQEKIQGKVRSLRAGFLEYRNPYLHTAECLVALDTHLVVGEEGTTALRKFEEIGLQQYNDFVQSRLVTHEVSFFSPIKKNNFRVFTSRKKKIGGVTATIKALEANADLFARLYLAAEVRKLDRRTFFKYEEQVTPPAVSKDGGLYPAYKAELLPCLEQHCGGGGGGSQLYPSTVDCLIYDGAALVHIIRPRLVSNFSEYWDRNLQKHITHQLEELSAKRIDIVWDLYLPNSLKTFVREGRGSGPLRQVLPNSPVPSNWTDFLLNDKNKEQLFKLLAYNAIGRLSAALQTLVVSNMGSTIIGSQTFSNGLSTSLNGLNCGDMEEADSRVFLHLRDAVENGCCKASIRTVDTDIVVLAISYFHPFKSLGLQHLWVEMGTGEKTRFIPCHTISHSIGERRSLALRGFHAFTGSDFTAGFRGRRKRTAWKAWESYPDATDAFIALTQFRSPSDLTDVVMRKLEVFTIILYGGDISMSSVDEARFILFTAKGKKLQDLPPTRNALVLKTLRAAYLAGPIWSQSDSRNPVIPSPQGWGWKMEGDTFVPVWTTDTPIWEACRSALTKCGCQIKTGCGSSCGCRKAKGGRVACTFFCTNCRGDCTNQDSP